MFISGGSLARERSPPTLGEGFGGRASGESSGLIAMLAEYRAQTLR